MRLHPLRLSARPPWEGGLGGWEVFGGGIIFRPDGLPAVVQTWNSGDVATNAYVYNKRRLLTSERQTHDNNDWSVGYAYNGLGHLNRPDFSRQPRPLGGPEFLGTLVV